jgi:aspartate aminotransferase-like enzyme
MICRGCKSLARQNGLLVCVDCISSIGAVPLDLSKVAFASGTSGKALGAYPGLSFIFFQRCYRRKDIPRYLDLDTYIRKQGIPFTGSSNLLGALQQALFNLRQQGSRYPAMMNQTATLQSLLKQQGIPLLLGERQDAPLVTTIPLPLTLSSVWVGDRLREQNIHVHYESSYLRARNWIQLASMSLYPQETIRYCVERLAELLPQPSSLYTAE